MFFLFLATAALMGSNVNTNAAGAVIALQEFEFVSLVVTAVSVGSASVTAAVVAAVVLSLFLNILGIEIEN